MRISYKIIEYENLLDSSNMTEQEWIRIAEDIMVKLWEIKIYEICNNILKIYKEILNY